VLCAYKVRKVYNRYMKLITKLTSIAIVIGSGRIFVLQYFAKDLLVFQFSNAAKTIKVIYMVKIHNLSSLRIYSTK
jgi:hypothetical protein